MSGLASRWSDVAERYDVVVIGSGYGGSIAAARFAGATNAEGDRVSVAVFERGPELEPSDFPRDEISLGLASAAATATLDDETIAVDVGNDPTRNMFVLHRGDIDVLVGSGLGGTSLINAAVAKWPGWARFGRAPWPRGLREDRDGLERGYARARMMLEPRTAPIEWPTLPKARAHERYGAELDGGPLVSLPLAVRFEDGPNAVGLFMRACEHRGDCVSGCPRDAKNTTAKSYLPLAKARGAALFVELTADAVVRAPDGWTVRLRPSALPGTSPPAIEVHANVVVVAAGVMGTVALLERSRREGLSVGDRLGEGFSGNGDALHLIKGGAVRSHAMGMGPRDAMSMGPVGSTITSEVSFAGGFVQEGTIPGVLSTVAPWLLERAAGAASVGASYGRMLASVLADRWRGETDHTHVFLGMKATDERVDVVVEDGVATTRRRSPEDPWYGTLERQLAAVAAHTGGTLLGTEDVFGPVVGRRLTVHPLGGCPMGDGPTEAVVDHAGRLFATDEERPVIVMDGSTLPEALGVNPMMTIAALAERSAARWMERFGWRESQRTLAERTADRPPGLVFWERMSGTIGGARVELHTRVEAEDVDAFILGRSAATVDGSARIDGVTWRIAAGGMTVERGRMTYRLSLRGPGEAQLLGTKQIDAPSLLLRVAQASVLEVRVEEGAERRGGVLTMTEEDALRMVTSVRITRSGGREVERLRDLAARFAERVLGWEVDRPPHEVVSPPARRVEDEGTICVATDAGCPVGLPPPRDHWIAGGDARLRRFPARAGGDRGAVILAPGFGVSTRSFLFDGPPRSIVHALWSAGFDVWLLDYRASPLHAQRRTFTLEQIAKVDWPEAVAFVTGVSGGAPAVLAHCLGSLTLLWSAASFGLGAVRRAVCSQVGLFLPSHLSNEVESRWRAGVGGPPSALLDRLGEACRTGRPCVDTRRLLRACSLPPNVEALFDLPRLEAAFARGAWGAGIDRLRSQARASLGWLFTWPPAAIATLLGGVVPEVERDLDEVYGALRDGTLDLSHLDVTPRDEPFDRVLDAFLARVPAWRGRGFDARVRRIFAFYGPSVKLDNLSDAMLAELPEMFGRTRLDAFANITDVLARGHLGLDEAALKRIDFPVTFLHGADNDEFLPEGTEDTMHLLARHGCDVARIVFEGYGHMDCFIGTDAPTDVFPTILAAV